MYASLDLTPTLFLSRTVQSSIATISEFIVIAASKGCIWCSINPGTMT